MLICAHFVAVLIVGGCGQVLVADDFGTTETFITVDPSVPFDMTACCTIQARLTLHTLGLLLQAVCNVFCVLNGALRDWQVGQAGAADEVMQVVAVNSTVHRLHS